MDQKFLKWIFIICWISLDSSLCVDLGLMLYSIYNCNLQPQQENHVCKPACCMEISFSPSSCADCHVSLEWLDQLPYLSLAKVNMLAG